MTKEKPSVVIGDPIEMVWKNVLDGATRQLNQMKVEMVLQEQAIKLATEKLKHLNLK